MTIRRKLFEDDDDKNLFQDNDLAAMTMIKLLRLSPESFPDIKISDSLKNNTDIDPSQMDDFTKNRLSQNLMDYIAQSAMKTASEESNKRSQEELGQEEQPRIKVDQEPNEFSRFRQSRQNIQKKQDRFKTDKPTIISFDKNKNTTDESIIFKQKRLFEQAGNAAVFTFGRMSPPTIGHQKLISAVINTAKQIGADHYIFVSQTFKPPKNPISWNSKVKYLSEAMPGVNIVTNTSIRTPFQALEELGKMYDTVIMVVGSDRVESFKTNMAKYVEQWGIENFDVVSAGERDPDSDSVEGMSASKMREFAKNDDFESFSQGVPSGLSGESAKQMFDEVRGALVK